MHLIPNQKFETKRASVRALLASTDQIQPFEFSRSNIWTYWDQVNLIWSALRGVPSGDIHLVRKGHNIRGVWLIDGKQRLDTWRGFIQGDIKIPMADEENNVALLSYSELQEDARDRFNNYGVSVVLWRYMKLDDQCQLFSTTNNKVDPDLCTMEEILNNKNLARFWK